MELMVFVRLIFVFLQVRIFIFRCVWFGLFCSPIHGSAIDPCAAGTSIYFNYANNSFSAFCYGEQDLHDRLHNLVTWQLHHAAYLSTIPYIHVDIVNQAPSWWFPASRIYATNAHGLSKSSST